MHPRAAALWEAFNEAFRLRVDAFLIAAMALISALDAAWHTPTLLAAHDYARLAASAFLVLACSAAAVPLLIRAFRPERPAWTWDGKR